MNDWAEADWIPLGDSEEQLVEFARIGDAVGLRDSRQGGDSPVLVFSPVEWEAFLNGVRDGEFDL